MFKKIKHMASFLLNKGAIGYYRLEFRDKVTSKTFKIIHGKNILTYVAADIITKLLAGDNKYKIAYIYGEHAPLGTYAEGIHPGLPVARTDTVAAPMNVSPRTTQDAEVNIIFPAFNNEQNYNNNIVTFHASFNDAALDNRTFVGIGLVARVNNVPLLFSHDYFPAHTKLPNHEIVIFYGIRVR
jgi:hypothetical protein